MFNACAQNLPSIHCNPSAQESEASWVTEFRASLTTKQGPVSKNKQKSRFCPKSQYTDGCQGEHEPQRGGQRESPDVLAWNTPRRLSSASVGRSGLAQVPYCPVPLSLGDMIPGRLSSARPWTMLEGIMRGAVRTPAGLRLSRLLPQQGHPRPLSMGCVDCTKHREPPGKKPLSEKKLVSSLGRRLHALWGLGLICALVLCSRDTGRFFQGTFLQWPAAARVVECSRSGCSLVIHPRRTALYSPGVRAWFLTQDLWVGGVGP